MTDAVIFCDAHVNEGGGEGLARLSAFLNGPCRSARRVFILGDLFNFWFGPSQAHSEPYSLVLQELAELARSGVEVTFYHGNRDFYFSRALADSLGVRLVEDYSIEEICGRRVLLCHGDMLCANDVSYHRMRWLLRSRAMRTLLMRLPASLARRLARTYRAYSKRSVAGKPQWVLGIDDTAVLRHFALGPDIIICGHTHRRQTRVYETGDGEKTLYALGDFEMEGAYIECDAGEFLFKQAAPSG